MQLSSIGAFAPLALLIVSFTDWSLSSQLFFLVFILIQYKMRWRGFYPHLKPVIWKLVMVLVIMVMTVEGLTLVIWAFRGRSWNAHSSWWLKLSGLTRFNPWQSGVDLIISLVTQFLVVTTAMCALYHEVNSSFLGSSLDEAPRSTPVYREGGASQLCQILRSVVLPVVQVIVGVARPCWITLPFFVCSCVGLFQWSMTSDFVGLSWGWRPLLLYTGLDILMLYSYQLPILYPHRVSKAAEYLGLFKVSHNFLGWHEALQGSALIVFYILLCAAIRDVDDSEDLISRSSTLLPTTYTSSHCVDDGYLQERLLPPELSSNEEEIMSYSFWGSEPSKSVAFQMITINVFVYGYPVCLIALVLWSFEYPSICAFVLLLYVAYTLYAFPSVQFLCRINAVLLGFILIWALSTYIFNAAFIFLRDGADKGTGVWGTIGLWHYSAPGLFLLAQFSLCILVGANIYACSAVLGNTSTCEVQACKDENTLDEEQQGIKVLVLAIAAWCISRSAHVISLVLILVVGLQHGLVYAIYMLFFFIYLLRSDIAIRTRWCLMVLCELHFAILYLLKLDMISLQVERQDFWLKSILLKLGLSTRAGIGDFMRIVLLLGFTAIQKQGFKLPLSLLAIVQKSAYPPVGFRILKAQISRSIIFSVYASHGCEPLQQNRNATVNWIMKHLCDIGEAIHTTYRSVGSYIVFLTVLVVVYSIGTNYISFGYFSLLLFWIAGRQLLGRTQAFLWFPLFIYSGMVLTLHYMLSCFPDLQRILGWEYSLYESLGFKLDASVIEQLWDSLVIVTVMQLFRYQRAQQSWGSHCHKEGDHMGYMGLLKRFLILHNGKILSTTVFYAGISPVSVMGFLYVVMLICTSNISKTSSFPARLYTLYTATVAAAEFLFLVLGEKIQLFPGQKHGDFALWLGFQVVEKSFWGMESAFRGKALVLASCLLQYSASCWLEQLPASLRKDRPGEEPCFLFLPYFWTGHENTENLSERESLVNVSNQNYQSVGIQRLQFESASHLRCMENNEISQTHILEVNPSITGLNASLSVGEVVGQTRGLSLDCPSAKESRQWSKRAMVALRKERYDAQLRTLKVYVKYAIENFFHLYGLEIGMLVLLIASFAVVNAISLMYVAVLGLCVLLDRHLLNLLWPFFVVLFAAVLLVEYVALGRGPPSWTLSHAMGKRELHCHNCWKSSSDDFDYCKKCWLGLVVDDRQMLVAYFMVFMICCFKRRSDFISSRVEPRSFHVFSSPIDKIAWKEIAYETKGQWTWLDHLKFLYYRHLLDIVLILVLITGTLQYDVLHLGYLTFALISFRMRVTILKRGTIIFQLLRFYNFFLISLSLIYQAPFFNYLKNGSCNMPEYLYEIVGFLKFANGFDITSRSAIIDITIFCGVGLQSSIFCSKEFDQVLRYLEAEEMDAKLQAQERKAAWKTEQLQRIRELEECKYQRRKQVEKIKMEMFHLQLNLDETDSPEECSGSGSSIIDHSKAVGSNGYPIVDGLPFIEMQTGDKPHNFPGVDCQEPVECTMDSIKGDTSGIRRRRNFQHCELPPGRDLEASSLRAETENLKFQKSSTHSCIYDVHDQEDSVRDRAARNKPQNLDRRKSIEIPPIQSRLSGVQMLGDSVAQVQTLGNKALANIAGLLNIYHNDSDDTEESATEEEGAVEESKHQIREENLPVDTDVQVGEYSFRLNSQKEAFAETCRRLRMISSYGLSRIRANIDVVCYFFFLIVYVWNYSLLTLVYPAALFVYACLVNPGPNQRFWLAMLIYTELNILLQYMYQISVNHCDCKSLTNWLQSWLKKLGIPAADMTPSFVISVLPLFLVYLTTLVQSSIKAWDGEWMSVNDRSCFPNRRISSTENVDSEVSSYARLHRFVIYIRHKIEGICLGILRYFEALIHGSEAPPHFVQVSMHVNIWPEDGIQPERIESGFNKLLATAHRRTCQVDVNPFAHSFSRVRVESIESSQNKQNTAIAVLEVIYAAPAKRCPAGAQYSSLTPAADVALEIQRAKDEGLPEEMMFPYPILSVIAGGKREIDLYAYIFGTDLVAFFLVALFYQSVIKNSTELLQIYQLEDQFPKEYVFVLMTLFFLIIVDRIIYLCSFALGKVLYYYFNLGLYTYYATHYAWQLAPNHPGSGLFLLRIFCLTKALSLSLQALQIKYGLPQKSSLFGQFLTRKVTNTNYTGFRLYRSLPFLYELRCILDWSCTATSLTMYDWLKLEDIYASLFLVQCDVKLVRDKHQLGERQGIWTKFVSGICLFLALICVIWAPMLMYSSGNPTNIANPVFDVQMQIDITTKGGKFTLYQTSLCEVISMTDAVAVGFHIIPALDPFDIRDEQLICCQQDADSLWLVPPPTLISLMDSINEDLNVISKWAFTRQRPKTKELASFTNQTNVPASIDLQEVLKGNASSVQITSLYPRYFRLTSTGEVHKLEGTENLVSGNLTLNRESQSWWSFIRDEASIEDGCGSLKGPIAIIVSEEVPQGLIGDTLSKFSITSLYITFVLALSRFIRLQCADLRMRIPYENLPSCDRLVAICEDIYAARAAGELALEEGLFWTLVKIYRSPHVLLEYTKVD